MKIKQMYNLSKRLRVYIIDANEFEFRKAEQEANYKAIVNEAEKEGTVYSLYGFQEAINNDEIAFDNSFVFFAYITPDNEIESIVPEI